MREPEAGGVWDPLSTPDIILPSQYFAITGAQSLSSEQRLMLAVLVDAVNILQSWNGNGSLRKRGLYDEAREWVFNHSSPRAFSFENVCEGLGIDPDSLRNRLSDTDEHRTPIRLRLKESGRAHNVTLNRVRHRARRSRRRAQE